MRVWTVLRTWVHSVACAAGFASPCGHWQHELVDGLCFNCAMKRIDENVEREVLQAMRDAIAAHPEMFRLSTQDQPTTKETIH